MKQEIIAIRRNVAAIGTQVQDVAEGLVGVQRAGIDTASSFALGVLIVASGGIEAAAGKIDEVSSMATK
jgi:hypothetical protein